MHTAFELNPEMTYVVRTRNVVQLCWKKQAKKQHVYNTLACKDLTAVGEHTRIINGSSRTERIYEPQC